MMSSGRLSEPAAQAFAAWPLRTQATSSHIFSFPLSTLLPSPGVGRHRGVGAEEQPHEWYVEQRQAASAIAVACRKHVVCNLRHGVQAPSGVGGIEEGLVVPLRTAQHGAAQHSTVGTARHVMEEGTPPSARSTAEVVVPGSVAWPWYERVAHTHVYNTSW